MGPLLFAWSTVAHASAEVVVQTDRPCVVVVNFAPYPSGGEVVVYIPDGKEGSQNVRIRNLLGEQQWAGKVDVGEGQRATLIWARGGMTYGPVEAMPSRTPRVAPRPAPLVAEPRPTPRPLQPARPTEDPLVAAVKQAAAEGGGGTLPPPPDQDRPITGYAASLTLTNRTGSWANVRLDGEVFEFRGEKQRPVELGSGVHLVEVRDFRDTELWWTGELWVQPDDVLELQFSKAAAPSVPGRPDAWREPSPAEPGTDTP